MHLRKTFYIFIIFIALLLSSFNTGHAQKANILVDHLNVRSGPGTDFEVVAKVHSDESYHIIQQQSDWIEIQLEYNTGWITAEYVSIKDEDDSNIDKQPSSMTTITIPADNIQVRTGPSTSADILFFANKGEQFNVISEADEWYEIKNEQIGFVHKNLIDVNKSFKDHAFKDQVFVIDAGHGGYDVGAISVNGSYEKDIALRTANELRDALTSLGATVYLTRESDEFIRLVSIVSLANLVEPNTFISIHYNSFPDSPSASGIVTHYYDQEDEKLANYIQQGLINITGARDRGTEFGDFQVLRHNLNEAVLLELGFISNEEEEQLLLSDHYQKRLVRGIVNGLIKYFDTK